MRPIAFQAQHVGDVSNVDAFINSEAGAGAGAAGLAS